MARLSDQTITEVRDAADLAELVRGRVQLNHRGGRWWGRCPFHEEDTPSFSLIPPENRAYYCFGCGESGDAIDWMQRQEGAADFAAAVVALGERFGVEVRYDEESVEQRRRRAAADARKQLLERAGAYYSEVLRRSPDAETAREYLADRGLATDLLERYGVGWSPSSGTALLERGRAAGYSVEQLVGSGLARSGRGGPADFFQARIMFPIKDAMGRIQGFGGRTLDPNERAKYVNSPEGPAFRKRTLLFGIDVARTSAAKQKWLVVAEGYTDVCGLAAAGIENAVACMGTALTAEQIRLAARYVDEVRLCFDADAAGEGAAWRSLEAAADSPIRLAGVRLPPGSDPGDLAQTPEGREALLAAVADSVPLVTYLVRSRAERAGPGSGERQAALDDITGLLGGLADSIEKDEAIRIAVSLLGLPRHREERLREETRRDRPPDRSARVDRAEGALDARALRERRLLVLAAARPDAASPYLSDLPVGVLREPAHRQALELLRDGAPPEAWPEELRELAIAVRGAAPADRPEEGEIREAAYRLQLTFLEQRAHSLRDSGDERGMLEALELARELKEALRGED